MTVTLQISGYLRANKQKNAETLLTRIGKALSLDLSGFELEQYWKDEALYRFHGALDLDDLSHRDAYFEIAMLFGIVASARLHITPPIESSEAENWDFEGSCEHVSVSGVESLDFRVCRSR